MKETIGKLATEAFQKDSGNINPQEIQRATEKEYLEELKWCVLHAQGKIDCSKKEFHKGCVKDEPFKGDFFIEALIKKEKLLENVIRNYFIPRKTCPTPHYDQTLYRYNSQNDEIEFIWCIPDKDTCEYLYLHRRQVQEKELLQQIIDFKNGSLMEKCKKFNKESMHAGVLLEL